MHWLLTVEPQLQFQVTLCEICGGSSGSGAFIYLQVSLIYSVLIVILSVSILICHCPLKCVIAMTRQHIVTSLVHRLDGVFLSDSAFGWLQNKEVSLLPLRSIVLRYSSTISRSTRELCCHTLPLVTWRMTPIYCLINIFVLMKLQHATALENIFMFDLRFSWQWLWRMPSSGICLPWRWRPYVPPKRWFNQDLQGATSQKTAVFFFFIFVESLAECVLH
jgi:hypothetical protein